MKLAFSDKEYNAISEYIHQNIRAYPKNKKSALINDYENIAYSVQPEQSKR